MKKELSPKVVLATLAIVLLVIGGVYYSSQTGQGGADHSYMIKPGMKPMRPSSGGGGPQK